MKITRSKLRFVSITRVYRVGAEADTSSLLLEPDGSISVVGGLPHYARFRPVSQSHAVALIEHIAADAGLKIKIVAAD